MAVRLPRLGDRRRRRWRGGAADLAGNSNLQDIVANLRVDQAWGSAQIAAAVRPMTGSYFGAGNQAGTIVEWNGHPGNDIGWAVSAGLRLNAPMIGPGDYFQAASSTPKVRRGMRRTRRAVVREESPRH